MTRDESINSRVSQFDQEILQAKGNMAGGGYDDGYTQGVIDGKLQGGGGLTQDDLDKAVANQKSIDDQLLVQAVADQKAADDAIIAQMQQSVDALNAQKVDLEAQLAQVTAELGAEHEIVIGLKGSVDRMAEEASKFQAILEALRGLTTINPQV